MRKSDELLEKLEIYASDFKENLKEYVDQRIYELVSGDCDSGDSRTYDSVRDIVQSTLDDFEVSADAVDGLGEYIMDTVSTPEISADDILGLKSAVREAVEGLTFEVSVS